MDDSHKILTRSHGEFQGLRFWPHLGLGNSFGTVDDPDIGSKKTGPPLPVRPRDPNRLGLVFQNVWVKLEEDLEVAFEGGFKGGFADILGSSKNARQKTIVLRDLPNGHSLPFKYFDKLR